MWSLQTHIQNVAVDSRLELPVGRSLEHIFHVFAAISRASLDALIAVGFVAIVVSVIADAWLKGIFTLAWLQLINLVAHRASFFHQIFNFRVLLSAVQLLFVNLERTEPLLKALLHLCPLCVAYVPLLPVK